MKYFLFLCLLLTFIGCKKSSIISNNSKTDTTTKTDSITKPTPPINVKTVVSKAEYTDNIEHNITYFNYDDSARLINQVDSGITLKSLYNLADTLVTSSTYQYDNSGNLIFREVSDKISDTTYNIFYQNGVPSYSNFKIVLKVGDQATSQGSIKYTLLNNKITALDFSIAQNTPYATYKIDYLGENIKRISLLKLTDTLGYVSFTYGTKLSPYSYSRFKWLLFMDDIPLSENLLYSIFLTSPNIYNQNDVESCSTLNYLVYNFIVTNTYNNYNLPTEIVTSNKYIVYQYINIVVK